MAKQTDNALVVKDVDGTEYNLLEAPGKETKYVVEAQQKLRETLQIDEMARDLANVGKFLLMAHCGVMGHLQLELQVRERLHSVVKLCDDTVHTLNEFSRASDNAINGMVTAYEYLIEGFEDIALETLQDVVKTSKNMENESLELEKRFGIEANQVENVHEKTLIERDSIQKANISTTKELNKLEIEESAAKRTVSETTADEEKASEEFEKIMKEEHDTAVERVRVARELEAKLADVQKKLDAADSEARMACSQAETGIFSSIKSGFIHACGGKTKDDIANEKVQISYSNIQQQHQDALTVSKELKEAEDEKAKTLEKLRAQRAKELEERRKKRDEALKQMLAVAQKLTDCKFEDSVQKESLYCLQHAVTALRNLQDIMRVAASFWRETYSACNAITDHTMIKRLDKLMTLEEPKRKRLWNTRALKMEAVRYYAQWVAIRQLCFDSREPLANSQRQVHMFIRQNPTKEQGKVLLGILAQQLTKDLQHTGIKEITYPAKTDEVKDEKTNEVKDEKTDEVKDEKADEVKDKKTDEKKDS